MVCSKTWTFCFRSWWQLFFLFLVAFLHQKIACESRSLQQCTDFDKNGRESPLCYRIQVLVKCRESSIKADDLSSQLGEGSYGDVQWKVSSLIISAETHEQSGFLSALQRPLHTNLCHFPPSSFRASSKLTAYEKGTSSSFSLPFSIKWGRALVISQNLYLAKLW